MATIERTYTHTHTLKLPTIGSAYKKISVIDTLMECIDELTQRACNIQALFDHLDTGGDQHDNNHMVRNITTQESQSRILGLAPKWLRLAPNGTNLGLFQITFQYILVR